MLDEVVVVGYGTQKKATLTGSISQVGGDEIKKLAAANLTNTLAGKTAGVIANTRSGEPGEDNADILIRGKGTLGSTAPLIVVDGIADRSFSRLNPEDIESISVLRMLLLLFMVHVLLMALSWLPPNVVLKGK